MNKIFTLITITAALQSCRQGSVRCEETNPQQYNARGPVRHPLLGLGEKKRKDIAKSSINGVSTTESNPNRPDIAKTEGVAPASKESPRENAKTASSGQ